MNSSSFQTAAKLIGLIILLSACRTTNIATRQAAVSLIPFPQLAYSLPPGNPVILYSDLINGPRTGGQNNKGAFITISGHRFGSSQGTSYVTVGGGTVDHYPLWSDTKITFQLGPTAQTGTIAVHTSAGDSNEVPFTVNNGSIYFVDANAVGPGDGTFANPWTSPDSFLSNVHPGDILYFRAGTYSAKYGSNWTEANFNLGSKHAGTLDHHVAYVAYPNEQVIVSGYSKGFNLNDNGSTSSAHFTTIAGFTIHSTTQCLNSGGFWQINEGGAHDIRFINNYCVATYTTQNTMTGIIAISSKNSYILGNDISSTATVAINNNHAIYIITGADNAYIGYNHFHDLKMGHVIQAHTDNAETLGYVWDNIHIFGNTITASNPSDCRGINIGDVGSQSSYGYIYNNLLYNVGQNFSAILVTNFGNWTVANNTLYNIKSSPVGNIRIMYSVPGRVIKIVNNVIYNTIDPTSPYIGADSGGSLSDPSITINSNGYYGHGNGPVQDMNAINQDPIFVDPANHNFQLKGGSPAIDAGVNDTAFAILSDILGISRPQGRSMDIGVFEFAPAAN